MRYILSSILLVFIFTGCSGSNFNLDFKISREKQEFLDRLDAMAIVDIDKNSLETSVVLPEAGNNLIYRIKLDGVKNVVAIRVKESDKINFENLLIKEKEYFYDTAKQELLINFNIPYIYLLDESIKYNVKIVYLNKDKILKNIEREFIFNYKGMKEIEGGHLSYKYLNTKDPKQISKLNMINKTNIKKELKTINKNRLSNKYRKIVNTVEREL